MKKIVKKFNNFVNETIFKVKNKTNDIFNNILKNFSKNKKIKLLK